MRILELFELPKNQWVIDISNDAKQDFGDDLVSLVQRAYKNTPQGSFVNNIKDVIPSDWNVIDFDEDPNIDACVFFRGPRSNEVWQGHKIQGIGHDGTPAGKQEVIKKTTQLLGLPGWWIESSNAMRAVLKRVGVPPVTDEAVLKRLFNDPNLTMIDQDTYSRHLPDGTEIKETVFGNPKLAK